MSGQIAIERRTFNDMLAGPGAPDAARALVMHELGHVLGLGHVPDRSQLMYRSGNSGHQLASGDRRGLALLGRGPCV